MRQVNLVAVLVMVLMLSVCLPCSEARRRVKRQQSNRSPFAAYFPPNKKFVRNRPSSTLITTTQPVRSTFFGGQGLNDLTTIRVSRPQSLQPPLEPKKPSRSRDFYACMTNCLTLSHYNPVCGTDHTTYHNAFKLDCANRCGARPRVQIRKPGIC